MNVSELMAKIIGLKGNMPIVVRGEDVIADIASVYVDRDHSDESEFLSIDLEGDDVEFKNVRKQCDQIMDINGNKECRHRRKIISGLDGCLCRKDNCFRLRLGRGNDGSRTEGC